MNTYIPTITILTLVILICAMFLAYGLGRLLKTNQYYCKLMENLYERRGVLIVCAVILGFGSAPFIPDNIYITLIGVYALMFLWAVGFRMNINFYGKIFGRKEDTAEEKKEIFKGTVLAWAIAVLIITILAIYWVNKSDKADTAGVQSGSVDSAMAGFGQTAPETNRQAGDRANPIVSQNESRQAFLHERGRQN